MTRRLLRGRVLGFLREPEDAEDTGAWRYHEDGAVLTDGGRIEAAGEHAAIAPKAGDAERIDHRPHLICPGFIDPHIHFPQVQVIA
jgi:guanine deaminase